MESKRLPYLDWLRITAILGVLLFHSAMPFNAEEQWHIKNKDTSYLLLEFTFFISRFRMPILFFVSGAVAHIILSKRTTGQFIGLRFRRLFIPLVVGMLFIVPIQVYLERVTQGFEGNFLDFYSHMFGTGAYPKGNISWHHLWFIAYLFVYHVALAPIMKWIQTKGHLSWISFFGQGARIYLLTVPSIVCYTLLAFHFPGTNDLIHDGNNFWYWLFFLVVGFLCFHDSGLFDSLERNRTRSFQIAVTSILIINYVRWNGYEPWDVWEDYLNHPMSYAFLSLYPITAWAWVFAAVGYAKRYLDFKTSWMDYANKAVYPFYILHQSVIVVIAFYVVQTTDTLGLKYLFTVILSFVITIGLYHAFIRPFSVMQFLFGAKSDRKV